MEKYRQSAAAEEAEEAPDKKGRTGLLGKLRGKKTTPVRIPEDPGDIRDEETLLAYLRNLKEQPGHESREDIAWRCCMELAGRAKEAVARIYQRDEEENGSGRVWRREDITSADLEKMICSGIPVTGSGNLQKMSASVLNSHFRQRRFSRQRMDSLEKRQLGVERFDLITLLFFIASQEGEELEPEIRCRAFIDEMNGILQRCGMMELYPVNPYEAFILMCLLSESPLATYSDIWELSYQEE